MTTLARLLCLIACLRVSVPASALFWLLTSSSVTKDHLPQTYESALERVVGALEQ